MFSWVEWIPSAPQEDRQRGSDLVVTEAGGVEAGLLVCFESAFPDLTRSLAGAGAELIVIQSATSTFQDSWTPEQHASLAALRAVESGRPVVHATLSGVSAIFDAEGRRLAWLGTDDTGTYMADVPLSTTRTLFVRWGDWVPALSFVVLFAAATIRGLAAAAREPEEVGRAQRADP